jgi:hypothetical protein
MLIEWSVIATATAVVLLLVDWGIRCGEGRGSGPVGDEPGYCATGAASNRPRASRINLSATRRQSPWGQ